MSLLYIKKKILQPQINLSDVFSLCTASPLIQYLACTTWCCLCWFFPLPRRAEWAPSSTSYSPGNRAVTCLPGPNRGEVISVSCATHGSLFFAAWEQDLCTGHPAYKWFNVFWLMRRGHYNSQRSSVCLLNNSQTLLCAFSTAEHEV